MARAKVTVTATDNLAKGLGESRKQLNNFEKYVSGVGNKLSKAFSIAALAAATVAGFNAMKNAAKECVAEYAEAEKVSMRLDAVWANVGAVSGKTAKQIDAYAEALEKQTYFQAESIKEASLLLAATQSLTDDGFDRALKASADLAAALGEDITGAAQTLAKAIQEPEAALSRLKTIGVSFTAAEKEQIKALTDANNKYEAQSLILDKIEQKYKDVAKAINDTPVGTLDNIKDVLADIRKNLGGQLLDVISPALEKIYSWLTKISEWTGNSRTTVSVIGAVREGTELVGYSDAELAAARANVYDRMFTPTSQAEAEEWAATGKTPWDDILKAIDDEIQRRLRNPLVPTPASPTTSEDETTSDAIEEAVSSLEKFLEKNGKASDKYMIAEYGKIIEEAEKYRTEIQSELFSLLSQGGTFDNNGKLPFQDQIDSLGLQLAYLDEIIAANNKKIEALIPEPTYTFPENNYQSPQKWDIEYVVPPTFADNLGKAISDVFVSNGYGLGGLADAFGTNVMESFMDKMGTAGQVAADLANNMATMGPALGGLMTSLEFVFDGIYQVIGPQLETLMTALIAPLTEIGKIIGSLILPILQLLTPVLNAIAKVVIVVSSTFQYIGQLLQHWVATVLNWLAGLSIFGWQPFAGLATYDPGSPGDFLDYVGNNLNQYSSSVSGVNSVGTASAISSAAYRGATSVTINIYAEGPIVGDGGMREFARMIRDEFDSLDYYGVTA